MLSFFFTIALARLSVAQYTLSADYEASNFFSQFTFWTTSDPTNGYVDYVDQATAEANGLIYTTSNQIYLGVDHTNVASGSGRESVRLTSTASYNHGLVILDLAHMPGSVCGTWPAFWMVGPNWPSDGEIDIIEGVNTNTNNAMTLHTSDGCTIDNDSDFTGTLVSSNCYIDAAGQSNNEGCDIQDPRTTSYGNGFNSDGGGVFATQWTSDVINIWFFPPSSIPGDISSGSPNPAGWGDPVAQFEGDCDIDEHFVDLQIVFDTTFCGDWAGNVWSSTPACASLASTCQDYVQNDPGAFAPSYWLINSLKVYEGSDDGPVVQGPNRNVTNVVKAQAPLKSTPLAMGGGLPKRRSRVRRSMSQNWK